MISTIPFIEITNATWSIGKGIVGVGCSWTMSFTLCFTVAVAAVTALLVAILVAILVAVGRYGGNVGLTYSLWISMPVFIVSFVWMIYIYIFIVAFLFLIFFIFFIRRGSRGNTTKFTMLVNFLLNVAACFDDCTALAALPYHFFTFGFPFVTRGLFSFNFFFSLCRRFVSPFRTRLKKNVYTKGERIEQM